MRRLLPMALLSLSLLACAGEVYVPGPPPPPQAEIVGVAPYPGAVWINGSYVWEGGRHVWLPGRWERPRPGYVWEPHRYEARGGRYVYVRGGWRRR